MRSKTETVWIKHTELNLMYRSQLSLYWLKQIRRSIGRFVHFLQRHSERNEEPLAGLWIILQSKRAKLIGGILRFARDGIGICAAILDFQLLWKSRQNFATRFG